MAILNMGNKENIKYINKNNEYHNNGNVDMSTNVNNIFIISPEFIDIYKCLSQKNNYSEFYKKYISKFKELENYSYNILFDHDRICSLEYRSNTLLFGKKILDWIYGFEGFPIRELELFYDDLKNDFDFDKESMIIKRWDANLSYFNNDINECEKKYKILYEQIKNDDNIPNWYKDDICIDGRNLAYKNNILNLDNVFQNELNKKNHKLTYPDIDRFKSEIFENLINSIIKDKSKSKYTTIYNYGLETSFSEIQKLTYLVILYGSITHLELIRKIISDVMFMYADIHEEPEFYSLALRMMFLNNDEKKFENVYNKIKIKYKFVFSQIFIRNLYDSRISLLPFEKEKNIILFFKIYGNLLEDELFVIIEKQIMNILVKKDNYVFQTIKYALIAIKKNIKRIYDKQKLINVLLDYCECSYTNTYDEIIQIISLIDITKLNKNEIKNLEKIICILLEGKDINFTDFSKEIVNNFKNKLCISKYNELFNNKESDDYIKILIDEGKEFEAIKCIVKKFKKIHDKNVLNHGTVYNYAIDYNIGNKLFLKKNYTKEVSDFFKTEYIPVATEILSSATETIYIKIKHIEILINLLIVENDVVLKKEIADSIYKSKNIYLKNESIFDFLPEKDEIDLEIVIKMCKVFMNEISYNNLLTDYIKLAINDEKNRKQILSSVKKLNKNMKLTEKSIEKLYILFNICYKTDDFDIKNDVISMMGIFIKTNFKTEIITFLERNVKDITFDEAIGFFDLISDNKKSKTYFKNIIESLKNSNDFYIKYIYDKNFKNFL